MAAIELNLTAWHRFFIISRPQKSTLLVSQTSIFITLFCSSHLMCPTKQKKVGEKRNHTPHCTCMLAFCAFILPQFSASICSLCSTARHAFVVYLSPLHKYLVIVFHPPSSILVCFFFSSREKLRGNARGAEPGFTGSDNDVPRSVSWKWPEGQKRLFELNSSGGLGSGAVSPLPWRQGG